MSKANQTKQNGGPGAWISLPGGDSYRPAQLRRQGQLKAHPLGYWSLKDQPYSMFPHPAFQTNARTHIDTHTHSHKQTVFLFSNLTEKLYYLILISLNYCSLLLNWSALIHIWGAVKAVQCEDNVEFNFISQIKSKRDCLKSMIKEIGTKEQSG